MIEIVGRVSPIETAHREVLKNLFGDNTVWTFVHYSNLVSIGIPVKRIVCALHVHSGQRISDTGILHFG